MSPYTPHAQIVETETIYGRTRQPTDAELELIEVYRSIYEMEFNNEPAGTHWIDGLNKMVLLRRAGGLPGHQPD